MNMIQLTAREEMRSQQNWLSSSSSSSDEIVGEITPLLLLSLQVTHNFLMIRFFCPIQSSFSILRTVNKKGGKEKILTLFCAVGSALHFSTRYRTILKFPSAAAKCNEEEPFWGKESRRMSRLMWLVVNYRISLIRIHSPHAEFLHNRKSVPQRGQKKGIVSIHLKDDHAHDNFRQGTYGILVMKVDDTLLWITLE